MRIAKSRLKEIILEELGSVDEGYREERTHYAINPDGNLNRILDLEKRLNSLEDQVAGIGEPLQEELLNENPLAALAPKVIEFVVKNPKILGMLAKALGPMLAKSMGGEDEKGGAAGGAMADLAGAVGAITEE